MLKLRPEALDLARYFIGTSGWHYDDWRNIFYPEGLPKAKWLEFYARHFPTVELNNSFYRLPSENAFAGWYRSSPDGFTFAVKVSRFITHIKRLKDCQEALDKFIKRARILEEKLGPLLYQLPPSFHRDDETLASFLRTLPRGLRHVIEFRHQSWLSEAVFQTLRQYNVGLCVFDMPSFTCPRLATADFAYIRFHGPEGLYSSSYSDEAMAGWARSIADLSKNLDSVYIYFNNDVAGFALQNAETIRHYLQEEKQI
jgi:uncharacterized protein YecE (DUF72 family)